MACKGWVLGKRLRKVITKVQKPNSKGWEKGRILKSLGEWNMSLQERVRRKQEYLDSRQRQLNSKHSESRFQHKARKVETDCLDSRDKSTTSRSTRSVEQTKAAKNETETSLQRAERLEVLSKTKEERLRRRQFKNEQSNSRCWATQKHERSRRTQDYNE